MSNKLLRFFSIYLFICILNLFSTLSLDLWRWLDLSKGKMLKLRIVLSNKPHMIVLLPNGMHFSPCYVYRKVECGYKDLKFFLFLVDLFHFYAFYEGSLVGGFWCSFVCLLGNMRVMESWSFLLFSTTK